MLSLPAALVLTQVCAAQVEPSTLLAIVAVESGFDPWAIGVNGPKAVALRPGSREAAVATAQGLIAAGRNIDLGLGQINHRNLARLGLTVEDAFEPCRNLAAASKVLGAGGNRNGPTGPAALSRYNTGDAQRGLRNGYVDRVTHAAAQLAPRLSQLSAATSGPQARPPAANPPAGPPRPDFVIYPAPFTGPGANP